MKSALVVLSCLVGLASCGTQPPSQRPEAAASGERLNQAPVLPASNPVESKAAVDGAGYEFVFVDSIESSGERIPVDVYLELIADGWIERDGQTFGNAPEGEKRSAEASPDFIAILDVNGSSSIVGFMPRDVVFQFPASSDLRIYGSDGRTVVGVIEVSQRRIDGQAIAVETFVPVGGGSR